MRDVIFEVGSAESGCLADGRPAPGLKSEVYRILHSLASRSTANGERPGRKPFAAAVLVQVEGLLYAIAGVNRRYALPHLAVCAEYGAVSNAVTLGFTEFRGIFILGPQLQGMEMPTMCGTCSDLVMEHAQRNFSVTTRNGAGVTRSFIAENTAERFTGRAFTGDALKVQTAPLRILDGAFGLRQSRIGEGGLVVREDL